MQFLIAGLAVLASTFSAALLGLPPSAAPVIPSITVCLAVFTLRRRPAHLLKMLLWCVLIGPVGEVGLAEKSAPLLLCDVCLTAIVFLTVVGGGRRGGRRAGRFVLVTQTAFFGLALAVTVALSADLLKAAFVLKSFAEGVAVIYVLREHVRTKQQVAELSSALTMFGVALTLEMLLMAAVDSGSLQGLWEGLLARRANARSTFGESNYLAGLLLLVAPTTAVIFRRSRLRAAAATLTIISGILLTSSRGAVGAGVVGTLLIGVAGSALFSMRKAVLVVLTAALLTVGALTALPGGFRERLSDRISLTGIDVNSLDRLQVWSANLQLFLDNPVFGAGVKSAAVAARDHLGRSATMDSHNTVLALLSETGAMGALLYLCGIYYTLRVGLAALRRELRKPSGLVIMGLLTGIVLSLLHGMVEVLHTGPEYSILFWMMCSLVVAGAHAGRSPAPAPARRPRSAALTSLARPA